MMRSAWRRGAIWILLWAAGHSAMALDPQRSLDHYGHQVWRTDTGLPQNTVHAILQTRDGYLWLGTDGGLVRFDGIDFVTYDSENTPQFASDTVYDLLQDASGALWISTAAGLLSYRDNIFHAYTSAQGLPGEAVWFSYEDRHHRLWAITTSGPAWFDGKVFVPVAGAQAAAPLNRRALAEDAQGTLWLGGSSGLFGLAAPGTAPPGLGPHLLGGVAVEALALDLAGNLWIGAGDGLRRYAGGRLAAPTPGQDKREVTALAPDAAGGLWVGTIAGLQHVSRDGAALPPAATAPPGGLNGERIDRLFRDRQGVLWIATERGIFRLVGNQMQPFAPDSPLATTRALAILEDREGNLWIGADSGGLHLLRDQKFTTYTTRDGLSGNFVRCVFQSAHGVLWIGTDGEGLNRRTSTGFTHLTTADGLSSNVILALADGSNGDLWVGAPNGLNLLHPEKPGRRIEHFTTADGLPDDFVRSLYTDRDGSLWIGTRHGLAHRSGGKFTSYSSMDGLGSDFIGAILRGDQADLYIGTSGGLSRMRGDAFTNLTVRQGLSNNTVTAIAQDAASTLWLGTNGGGLNRLRPEAIQPANPVADREVIRAFPRSAQALPGAIYGILQDLTGNLWLSSQTGIFRVSIAQLDAYAAGSLASLAATAYGADDGMNIRECSGGGHPAAWRLADGSLWFATLDGVSVIDPSRATQNRVPPPVVMEQVLVDDQPRPLGQPLTIPPGANRLEFQYAGLSFAAPKKVQYRYQLQGFDRDWIDAGGRRAAFYTNLPPGRYRFRVIAANNDGVWNTTGASLAMRLLPHVYQTWWFYSLLAMAGVVLGYGVYRWRVLQVETQWGAVLAERGRLAREIHDTLAQGFVGISVQLELVARLLAGARAAAPKRELEPAWNHLDQARALVRSSLAEARTSIWDLRSQAAGAEDLPARLKQSCSRLSNGSAAKVYLQVKGTYRSVARKIEEQLLRIGQEAVANAVRHATAKRIDVQLIYQATRVSLEVADDGRGFTPLPGARGPEGHFGIQGMHERATEIGATLVLDSTPNRGTRVSVEVPLP